MAVLKIITGQIHSIIGNIFNQILFAMKKLAVIALSAAAIIGCSKENTNPGPDATAQKLNVLTSIQTRSAIDGTTMPVGSAIGVQLTDELGTGAFNGIALTPTGEGYYTDANNVRFINEAGENLWVSKTEDGADKLLMMTGANKGKVYAYYPYTASLTGLGTAATIPVSILNSGEIDVTNVEAGEPSVENDIDKYPAVTAEEEIDYLWHTPDENMVSAQTTSTAKLNFNHALARVSFRVYTSFAAKQAVSGEEGSYYALVGYTIKNKTNSNELHAVFEGATMNISTGAITGTTAGGEIQRTVKGYKMEKAISAEEETNTGKAAKRVSNLLFPLATITDGNSDNKSDKIELVLHIAKVSQDTEIEDVDASTAVGYAVPFDVTTVKAWEAGKNYTYTIKFTGSSLSVESVNVAAWTETVGGDMEVE